MILGVNFTRLLQSRPERTLRPGFAEITEDEAYERLSRRRAFVDGGEDTVLTRSAREERRGFRGRPSATREALSTSRFLRDRGGRFSGWTAC